MNTNPQGPAPKKFRNGFLAYLFALLLLSYPLGTLIYAYVYGDSLVLQKCVVRWIYPAGLLLILATFIFATAFLRRQRLIAFFALVAILVSSCAIDPVAKVLVASLEDRYPDVAAGPLEPFDYIVVLGGCTGVTTGDRPQVNQAGDRLVLAAKLYHDGTAKKLIVTGDELFSNTSKYPSPREQSTYLLIGMGVPADSILTLPGRNTAAEMASLKEKPEYWKGKRCGLITSAFHMSRAMRLAGKADVELIAIPTDFIQPNGPTTPLSFVPTAENIRAVTNVANEYLGMFVGR